MGVRKFPSWAAGLASLAAVTLVAVARADPLTDSRLIFDPTALDHSPLSPDRASPQSTPSPPRAEPVWNAATFQLPSFAEDFGIRGVADGLSFSPSRSASADANGFQQRVTFGTLSIGLETETTIKQRSLSGDGEKDPERDAVLDPKRQRGFLPFIGLSAKSSLP